MRIALTANGPGEVAGWVRPLLAALLRLAPETEATLFLVPDDYATGREAEVMRRLFPTIAVVAPGEYVRFALGRERSGREALGRMDVVQYLGGDLAHAARVRTRLGGELRSYKFARPRLAATIARAYAIDARNVRELERAKLPARKILEIGNLAIDGALREAAGDFAPSGIDAELAPGAVLFLPGNRRLELANMVPMFLETAWRLRERRPDLHCGFAISAFANEHDIARAANGGGHRNAWSERGRVVPLGAGLGLQSDRGGAPFPIVRDAMRHASRAAFAVTLPGTKCIELAALGVPALVVTPLNAPEVAVINGIFQYVDRIPALTPLKRALVVGVDRRFARVAQPNIDADAFLMPELRGTQMPGELARRIAAYAGEASARAEASAKLRALYAAHVGAAERMARDLLEAHA